MDNYRGITLLSVVGKLYTSILTDRISKWVEKRKKLVEEQGGFRGKIYCGANIYLEGDCPSSEKEEKNCMLLDIRKAYHCF